MPAGTVTLSTCGMTCWYAREADCRCSCGGAGHGVLLVAGAEQPRRNCTILGARYVLGRVVAAYRSGDDARWAFAMRSGARARGEQLGGSLNTRGAIMWTKIASVKQAEWPEAAPFAEYRRRPSLVWVRADMVEAYDAFLARVSAGEPAEKVAGDIAFGRTAVAS